MTNKNTILKAMMAFERGERPEKSRPERARFFIQNPTTRNWLPLKAIWALATNQSSSAFKTSVAKGGLEEIFEISDFGEDRGLSWEKYVERVQSGEVAPPDGESAPASYQVEREVKNRSGIVSDYALARAGKHCEACEEEAPFIDVDGRPFLEVHHILPLAQNGPDTPSNTVALCPNCHRRAHHSKDRETFMNNLKSVRAASK